MKPVPENFLAEVEGGTSRGADGKAAFDAVAQHLDLVVDVIVVHVGLRSACIVGVVVRVGFETFFTTHGTDDLPSLMAGIARPL